MSDRTLHHVCTRPTEQLYHSSSCWCFYVMLLYLESLYGPSWTNPFYQFNFSRYFIV